MGWSEFDDSGMDDEPKQRRRKPRKHPHGRDENGEEASHRQKRSGKRFHRKKTPKDDFWQGGDGSEPPKR